MIIVYWIDWLLSRLPELAEVQRSLIFYVGVLVALAVICAFWALRHFVGVHSQTAERLEAHVALQRAEEEEERARARKPGLFSRIIMRLSIARSIAADLERADLALSVPEYMLIMASAAAVAFVLGLLRGSVFLGMLLGIAALVTARLWVSRRARKRRQAFARQLNDVINLIVGALRAGYGTVQAMSIVMREMPAPASQEMARIVREVQLGLPFAAALDRSVERLQNDDWALIVTSMKIQAEVGGNLAEILDTVAATIRERVRILGEIRVLTTQQRLTGWLLSILPIALALILFAINPEYMSGLFTPGLPFMLTIMGVIGIALGAIVIRRIVAIEV
ncbi:MAG: type II secretion system F family protein [Anaerolineae bacterium]